MRASRSWIVVRSRPWLLPRARSAVSIAAQPSKVTTSTPRSASSATTPSPPLASRVAEVLEQRGDRRGGVLLVGADDPGGTALDPARDVEAGHRGAVGVDDAAVDVGDDVAAVVERHALETDPAVADRADHELGADLVGLAGAVRRRSRRPSCARRRRCSTRSRAAHLDGARVEVQVDVAVRAVEHVLRPALDDLDVARHDPVALDERGADRLELEVVRVLEHDVDTVELGELLELLRRPGRLRGPATTEHVDVVDRRAAQRVEHVLRHVGGLQPLERRGEHAGDVDSDVADADDDDGPGRGERALHPLAVGVGVAAVPGHEVGRGDAAGEVLARDVEATVARGAVGEHDGVVGVDQLGDGDVAADLDAREQAHARLLEDLLQRVAHAADRVVVRGHAVAHEPEGHREPVEDVDVRAGGGQGVCGVEARGAGADHSDPHRHGRIRPHRRPRVLADRPHGSPRHTHGASSPARAARTPAYDPPGSVTSNHTVAMPTARAPSTLPGWSSTNRQSSASTPSRSTARR